MINVNVNVKTFVKNKKDYSLNTTTCTRANNRYLKCIADISVIVCNEINVMNNASEIVTGTVSINSDGKKT